MDKKYIVDNLELMKEWDWDKNKDFIPSKIAFKSHKKVWWKCSKGHEWQATISHRNNGRGCPQCAKEKRKKK